MQMTHIEQVKKQGNAFPILPAHGEATYIITVNY